MNSDWFLIFLWRCQLYSCMSLWCRLAVMTFIWVKRKKKCEARWEKAANLTHLQVRSQYPQLLTFIQESVIFTHTIQLRCGNLRKRQQQKTTQKFFNFIFSIKKNPRTKWNEEKIGVMLKIFVCFVFWPNGRSTWASVVRLNLCRPDFSCSGRNFTRNRKMIRRKN